MALHPVFAQMRDLPLPSDDRLLEAHLGHEIAEILLRPDQDVYGDLLSREECRRLVQARAAATLDDPGMAACVAHVLWVAAPLAASLQEIDAAAAEISRWMVAIEQDDVYEEIVSARHALDELGAASGPPAGLSEDERSWWHTRVAYFRSRLADGEVSFLLGGRRVAVQICAAATVMIAEDAPGSSSYVLMAVFIDLGRGWGPGHDPDPEPEPDPTPAAPDLLDA